MGGQVRRWWPGARRGQRADGRCRQVHVRVRKQKPGAAAMPGAQTHEAAAHLALAGVWGALGCSVSDCELSAGSARTSVVLRRVSSGDGSRPVAWRQPTLGCPLWLPLLGRSPPRALPGSLFLPAHSDVASSGRLTSSVEQEHPLPPAAIAGFPYLLYLRKPLSKALPADDLMSPCSSPWNTSSLRTEAGLASGTLSILHGHLLIVRTARHPSVFRSERGSHVCDAVGGSRG